MGEETDAPGREEEEADAPGREEPDRGKADESASAEGSPESQAGGDDRDRPGRRRAPTFRGHVTAAKSAAAPLASDKQSAPPPKNQK